jgi:hypothetical protein
MATYDRMEEMWGVAATHAEHHINDSILYCIQGQTRTGTIIWICIPTDQDSQSRSVRYVVQPDETDKGLDLVAPSSILIENVQRQTGTVYTGTTSAGLEAALIEMLSTLSIPLGVKMEIDDAGRPFYVWHIGASTPQQPFGLYVGTDRQLVDALKAALERLIKHCGEHE